MLAMIPQIANALCGEVGALAIFAVIIQEAPKQCLFCVMIYSDVTNFEELFENMDLSKPSMGIFERMGFFSASYAAPTP